jgi:hypothetical protein
MTDGTPIREWLAVAEQEATVQSMAYAERLTSLSWLNLATVLLPALLSTAAAVVGAMSQPPIVTRLAALPLATILSAAAAVFITFHKSLKCDEYQTECRRLSQEYKAFSLSAGAALALPLEKLLDAHDRLSTQFAVVTKGANASVPYRYVERAWERLRRQGSHRPGRPPNQSFQPTNGPDHLVTRADSTGVARG